MSKKIANLGLGLCLVGLFMTEAAVGYEDGLVLPKGVFRARMIGAETSTISNKLNEDGKSRSYVTGLNQKLKTAQLLGGAQPTPTQAQLQQLVGMLEAAMPGSTENALQADLSARLQNRTQTAVAALEYGWTSNLSLGLRVPVVREQVDIDFDVRGQNNFGQIAAAMKNDPRAALVAQAGAYQLNTRLFEQALFTSKGYDAPRDFESQSLGDVEVGGKYQLFNDGDIRTSVLMGVRMPTGQTESLSNAFDTGAGEGVWALGVQGFQDVFLNSDWTVGANFMTHLYLPETRERAVPRSADDLLPSLRPEDGQVQDVTRAMAPKFDLGLYSKHNFWKERFNAWAGYNLTLKGEDDFSGDGSGLDYGLLEETSDYQRQTGEVGVGYSSIRDYRAGRIAVPFEASLLYNQTLAGINIPEMSYVRLDMNFYF